MSASIYDALDTAGFRGAFLDGDPRIMQWRSGSYLYHYRDEPDTLVEIKPPARVRRSTAKSAKRDRQEPPYIGETLNEDGLFLLSRHRELSADVGLRFSNNAWAGYPLYADAYAGWIARAAGDFVLISWDFENLGERHNPTSGIFDFMRALPGELEKQGISMRTPGELIECYAGERAYYLPLPVHPPAWSEMLGLESISGCEPQRELFQLLRDIYNLARLTEQPELLDLAIWLAQADNFRLVQGASLQLASVGTPQEWWHPAPADFLREQKQVYLNVLSALEPYLPARLLRQARHKPPISTRQAKK